MDTHLGHPPWPTEAAALVTLQEALAQAAPPPWTPAETLGRVAGCFVTFPRGGKGDGARGDPGWAGAALVEDGALVAAVAVRGEAGAPYAAGLLALREGPLLEAAVRALPALPDLLLVNATGRDHPRGAGLALHLGARLGIPSVGVTHDALFAQGAEPGPERGARSPLLLEDTLVGYWLRTSAGARPLAVHAGWRTTPMTAVVLVLACSGPGRTPLPLREARRAARTARAHDPDGRVARATGGGSVSA